MGKFNLLESHNSSFFEDTLGLTKAREFPALESKKSWIGKLWNKMTYSKSKVLDEVIRESNQNLKKELTPKEMKALSENLKQIIQREASTKDANVRKRIESLFRLEVACETNLQKLQQLVTDAQEFIGKFKTPESFREYVTTLKKCNDHIQTLKRVGGEESLINSLYSLIGSLERSYREKSPDKILCYYEDKVTELSVKDLKDNSQFFAGVDEDAFPQFIELRPDAVSFLRNPESIVVDDSNSEYLAEIADKYDMPILKNKYEMYLLTKHDVSDSNIKLLLDITAKFNMPILSNKCEMFLVTTQDVSDSNIKWLLNIATKCNMPILKNKCEMFLLTKVRNPDSAMRKLLPEYLSLAERFDLKKLNNYITKVQDSFAADRDNKKVVKFRYKTCLDVDYSFTYYTRTFSVPESVAIKNPQIYDYLRKLESYHGPRRLLEHVIHFATHGFLDNISVEDALSLFNRFHKEDALSSLIDHLKLHLSRAYPTFGYGDQYYLDWASGGNFPIVIDERFYGPKDFSFADIQESDDPTQRQYLEGSLSTMGTDKTLLRVQNEDLYVDPKIIEANPFLRGFDKFGVSKEAMKGILEFLYFGSIETYSFKEAVEMYRLAVSEKGLEPLKMHLEVIFKKMNLSKAMADSLDAEKDKPLAKLFIGILKEKCPDWIKISEKEDLITLELYPTHINYIEEMTEIKTLSKFFDEIKTHAFMNQDNGYNRVVLPLHLLQKLDQVKKISVDLSKIPENFHHRISFDSTPFGSNNTVPAPKLEEVRFIGTGPYRIDSSIKKRIRKLEGSIELKDTEYKFSNLEVVKCDDAQRLYELQTATTLREIYFTNRKKERMNISLLERLVTINPNLRVLDLDFNYISGTKDRINALKATLAGRLEAQEVKG